ncbi:YHS domain-containing (seleno)protein [Geminicoccus flavidas]|uniref:YHS domain-containing (seleno)protein n=1 Tax=Geminicoccus flavidas TaxID=2506407 RepID=UPI0013571D6C|nr:YHS domain-containing (seleno)protein [Geminicoccus flavidas]
MNLDLSATCRIRGAAVCAILLAAATAAAGERINKDADNLAIRGYDTVAYFTEGRPVRGKPEFAYVWQDARWQFASAEHRDLFAGEPDRYAPQFGGFCTGGVGLGRLAPIDPEAWVIVDGRLYLHYDRAGRDETVAHPDAQIAAATEQWKELGRTP